MRDKAFAEDAVLDLEHETQWIRIIEVKSTTNYTLHTHCMWFIQSYYTIFVHSKFRKCHAQYQTFKQHRAIKSFKGWNAEIGSYFLITIELQKKKNYNKQNSKQMKNVGKLN